MGGVAPNTTSRVTRVISYAFAIAVVFFGSFEAPNIITQAADLSPWWTAVAVAVVFGLCLALAVTASWAPPRIHRAVAIALAVGYPLVLLALPAALHDHALGTDSPWPLQLTVFATSAAAMAWARWPVWLYVAGMAVLTVATRVVASPQPIWDVALQDGIESIAFNSIFAGLMLVTIRAGALLDAEVSSVGDEAIRAARLEGVERERLRLTDLIHDEVLSTLLAASRAGDEPHPSISRQATRSLLELTRHRDADADDQPADVDAETFIWRQQALATELAPDAVFTFERVAAPRIPGPVARALTEAAAEALRNSVRHAGAGARRQVHVRTGVDSAEITVLDDGIGFDPDLDRPARLGLRVGIRGRMARIVGGEARIVSSPARGTVVVLRWAAP